MFQLGRKISLVGRDERFVMNCDWAVVTNSVFSLVDFHKSLVSRCAWHKENRGQISNKLKTNFKHLRILSRN